MPMLCYADLYRSVPGGVGSSARSRWPESATVRTNSDRADECRIVRRGPARHSLAILSPPYATDRLSQRWQIGHWFAGFSY